MYYLDGEGLGFLGKRKRFGRKLSKAVKKTARVAVKVAAPPMAFKAVQRAAKKAAVAVKKNAIPIAAVALTVTSGGTAAPLLLKTVAMAAAKKAALKAVQKKLMAKRARDRARDLERSGAPAEEVQRANQEAAAMEQEYQTERREVVQSFQRAGQPAPADIPDDVSETEPAGAAAPMKIPPAAWAAIVGVPLLLLVVSGRRQ
jgi:hypothetical protein